MLARKVGMPRVEMVANAKIASRLLNVTVLGLDSKEEIAPFVSLFILFISYVFS